MAGGCPLGNELAPAPKRLHRAKFDLWQGENALSAGRVDPLEPRGATLSHGLLVK